MESFRETSMLNQMEAWQADRRFGAEIRESRVTASRRCFLVNN
jgi:hypothetical protein